jgi:hypothetical protein
MHLSMLFAYLLPYWNLAAWNLSKKKCNCKFHKKKHKKHFFANLKRKPTSWRNFETKKLPAPDPSFPPILMYSSIFSSVYVFWHTMLLQMWSSQQMSFHEPTIFNCNLASHLWKIHTSFLSRASLWTFPCWNFLTVPSSQLKHNWLNWVLHHVFLGLILQALYLKFQSHLVLVASP